MVGKLGKEITKCGMVGPRGSWKQRERLSLFQVLLNLMLRYEKRRTW
jgi:hypothetical protein